MIKEFFQSQISPRLELGTKANLKFQVFFEETFVALTVSSAVFGAMEVIRPRIVLAYVNLSYLLLGWLVFGIILLVISAKNKE